MTFSLDERRALAARAASVYERTARACAPAEPDAVRAALGAWSQAFSPGDADAFARRLSWDGLTLDAVSAAAGLPDVDPHMLAWTDWLEPIAEAARRVARDLREGSLHERALELDPPLFVDVWIAVLRAARTHCGERFHLDLERHLLRELALHGNAALIEAQNEFAGGHHEFVLAMLDAGLAPLWSAYPVLARQVAILTDRWIAASDELRQRLEADRVRIAAQLNDGRDPGPVSAITCGLSDPHDGGRRVAIVRFAGNLRVVYKPRPLQIDAAFERLIAWLRARGLDPLPPAPRVIEGDGYGWVEYVGQDRFESIDEIHRYYRQAGVLVLLTHVLGSKDLHMENLIASRRGPTLIDLEMLLQPGAPAGDDAGVDSSCLRTGLVSVIEFGADDEPCDIGGLRGAARSGACAGAPVCNAVMLNGVRQTADAYAGDLLDGFTRAYEFVLAHRAEIAAADSPLAAFAAGAVRVLVRPTNQYGLLSAARGAPRYLRDGLVRSMVADIMLRPLNASRTVPQTWPILIDERRAVEALDVPRFVVPAEGRGVWAEGRLLLDDCYGQSPLDAVRQRLDELSIDDCAAQRRTLARALGESPATRLAGAVPADADDLVGHAEWIGREILAAGAAANGRGGFHHDLYSGSVGPAILFAALARATGAAAWRRAAVDALAPAVAWAESGAPADEPLSIGGCSGLGSAVYGLACAGSLVDDERALAAATKVASLITHDRIAADRRFDIVDGAAGAIVGVLALHATTDDVRLLEIAAACGEHLIASHDDDAAGWAWPTDSRGHLVGYAHGAAGIGAALLRAAAATGCGAYRDAGEKALAFVARAFAPADASWPIALSDRVDPGSAMGRMNAWCHGAPGVAVAAAAALDSRRSGEILAQAREAVGRLARWDANQADHLCCGHLGRADVLLTAGERLIGPGAREQARELARRVVARARRHRHFRLSTPGFEYRVRDFGLFRGLAGVGYALLRASDPDSLPSVLAFEVMP